MVSWWGPERLFYALSSCTWCFGSYAIVGERKGASPMVFRCVLEYVSSKVIDCDCELSWRVFCYILKIIFRWLVLNLKIFVEKGAEYLMYFVSLIVFSKTDLKIYHITVFLICEPVLFSRGQLNGNFSEFVILVFINLNSTCKIQFSHEVLKWFLRAFYRFDCLNNNASVVIWVNLGIGEQSWWNVEKDLNSRIVFGNSMLIHKIWTCD